MNVRTRSLAERIFFISLMARKSLTWRAKIERSFSILLGLSFKYCNNTCLLIECISLAELVTAEQ